MEKLAARAAPKREERLRPCISYGGTLCGLKSRVDRGCLGDSDRSFSQGSICLMLPALAMLNSLPDNVTILHGAVGCGVCSHSQNANARSGSLAHFGVQKDALWVSTAMNEAEVISGGEQKLKAAILEVDRLYRPKTIAVVASCVPGITGDDVEGVIADARPLVHAALIPVYCEGFKTKVWATAYDAVYHGLLGTLLEDPPRPQPVIPDEGEEALRIAQLKQRRVNLCNVSSMGKVDEDELVRLLQGLGCAVNLFPVFTPGEEMWKVKYAALSISTCPTHDDYFLKRLEERWGVPFILKTMPIGIENTGEWLRDVGAFFGREEGTERFIQEERRRLETALEPYRRFFAGKRVFVSAGEFRALATAGLLAELGFTIIGVRSFHHDEFAVAEYGKLQRAAGDFPFNIANAQPFEEANLLKRLRPDLFLGHWNGNGTAAKLGVPSHVIYNTGLAYIGYRGAFELARRLYRQLCNPVFAKRLGAHNRLPYREGWYGEDPFSHIKDDDAKGGA